ncbi:MAG: hypothetical protein Q9162_000969 [Coniocarpon cinnabarinum]
MGVPIKGRVVCITGDFGAKRTAADLKRWIESNGGQFCTGVSAHVTHLVCSKAAWKAQNPVVKAALKFARINIVSYDWLEDSLLEGRKQPEAPYLWTNLEKKRAEKNAKIKEDNQKYIDAKQPVKSFVKGCSLASEDLHSDNYHIYQDDTTFAYHITLTRPDAQGINLDKIVLRLYETNTRRPAQYAVVAIYDKHEPTTRKPDTRVLVPIGCPFHTAFAAFRKFFQKVTGVEWDFRCWNNTIPVSMGAKAALRKEGWRVEAVAGGESMPRIEEASKSFLEGDGG